MLDKHLNNLFFVFALAHGGQHELAPGIELLAQASEVWYDIRAQAFDKIDAIRPVFEVDIWRWRWWSHVIDAGQAHTGHISREEFTGMQSEEHTSELQSRGHLVCR